MKSLRPKPGTEPSEIWQANEAKAKEAVRPIDILTESSNRALVLLYRFEGSRKRKLNCGRCALATHLENCTGKTFREKQRTRKIPVRSV